MNYVKMISCVCTVLLLVSNCIAEKEQPLPKKQLLFAQKLNTGGRIGSSGEKVLIHKDGTWTTHAIVVGRVIPFRNGTLSDEDKKRVDKLLEKLSKVPDEFGDKQVGKKQTIKIETDDRRITAYLRYNQSLYSAGLENEHFKILDEIFEKVKEILLK